jgi:hypothetical protein
LILVVRSNPGYINQLIATEIQREKSKQNVMKLVGGEGKEHNDTQDRNRRADLMQSKNNISNF